MFHVEQCLFPDTEPPEERIQHILDASATGDLIERHARLTEGFGSDERVTCATGLAERRYRCGKSHTMPGIQRDLAFARHQLLRARAHVRNEAVEPLARHRRNGQTSARSLRKVRLGGDEDRLAMRGRVL